jgi:acetyl-CoA C-acetyltransferase
VIVGVGQAIHRPSDAGEPSSLGLMTEAGSTALGDAGGSLRERIGSVAVVESFSWKVGNPGALVAAELGLSPAETLLALTGGNAPITLLGDLCTGIAGGALDAALLVGAEAFNPFMRAFREGRPTGWPVQPEGTAPTRTIGSEREPNHPVEQEAGLIAPVAYYPLLESAVRGAAGRSPREHASWLGALWERVGAPARTNPFAWTPDVPDAATIATPSASNRLVTVPYTKLLNANVQVDQGAALLVCSVGAARAARIPSDRWVFVAATAGAADHWHVGERERLDRSPAIAACSSAALSGLGLELDDVAHLDLYSCFPSAVQIAAREIGLDLSGPESGSRSPSATGGLTFAGGPGSNYATHALARLVERVRDSPESFALATAVGWYLTKHGVAVLSGRPLSRAFADIDAQASVDALPSRSVVAPVAGVEVTLEAYTAIYERDGTLSLGIASCLLDDETRTFARSDDPAVLAVLGGGEVDPLGARVALEGGGRFAL